MKVVKTDKESYIRKYVDVFSSITLDEEMWLTPREKDFFVYCVLINSEDIELSSKEAVDELTKRANFKDKLVYIYRDKLKKKGWLLQTKEGIKVPPTFDFRGRDMPDKLTFKFILAYEHSEQDNRSRREIL